MRRKTNCDPLDYLQRRVLDPLGIAPTHWRRGSDGMPHMPSGAGLTARDWARFGWFVLRDGEGRVDAHALAQCFVGSRANPGYGLSWWLLRDGLVPPGRRAGGISIDTTMAESVGGIVMAAGAGDQRLYLLPGLDLVIARQATGILQALRQRRRDRNGWSDADFLRTLLRALSKALQLTSKPHARASLYGARSHRASRCLSLKTSFPALAGLYPSAAMKR